MVFTCVCVALSEVGRGTVGSAVPWVGVGGRWIMLDIGLRNLRGWVNR